MASAKASIIRCMHGQAVSFDGECTQLKACGWHPAGSIGSIKFDIGTGIRIGILTLKGTPAPRATEYRVLHRAGQRAAGCAAPRGAYPPAVKCGWWMVFSVGDEPRRGTETIISRALASARPERSFTARFLSYMDARHVPIHHCTARVSAVGVLSGELELRSVVLRPILPLVRPILPIFCQSSNKLTANCTANCTLPRGASIVPHPVALPSCRIPPVVAGSSGRRGFVVLTPAYGNSIIVTLGRQPVPVGRAKAPRSAAVRTPLTQ